MKKKNNEEAKITKEINEFKSLQLFREHLNGKEGNSKSSVESAAESCEVDEDDDTC